MIIGLLVFREGIESGGKREIEWQDIASEGIETKEETMANCQGIFVKRGMVFRVISGNEVKRPVPKNGGEQRDPSSEFYCVVFEEMMSAERCRKLKLNDPSCTFCERF